MKIFKRKGSFLVGGLAASCLILLYLVADSWDAVWVALAAAHPGWLAASALWAGLSYAFVGLSLRGTLRLLGHPLGLADSLKIGFVSTAVNYVLSTAGLSGFALKAWLLRRLHVPYGVLVTASVLTSVFFYGVLVILMAQGFMILALRAGGTRLELAGGAAGLVGAAVLTLVLGVGFFHHEFRTRFGLWVFHSVNRILFAFSGGSIPRERFDEFDAQIAAGLADLRREGWRLAWPVACVCGDWFFTLLTLDAAFRSVGAPLDAATLLAGFSAGMLATLLPVLPAGMGAVEASMATVFSRLGTPWGTALAACLVFRIAYYVVPGLISVAWIWAGDSGGLHGGFNEEETPA